MVDRRQLSHPPESHTPILFEYIIDYKPLKTPVESPFRWPGTVRPATSKAGGRCSSCRDPFRAVPRSAVAEGPAGREPWWSVAGCRGLARHGEQGQELRHPAGLKTETPA